MFDLDLSGGASLHKNPVVYLGSEKTGKTGCPITTLGHDEMGNL
jgi:hypothetical protein